MITGRISGDGAVMARLQAVKISLREELRRAVTQEAIQLVTYVKARKLSGQVLKNRTGTLRRKVNFQTTETASSISASVGVNLSYAAAHEYGLDKVESVRAHLRRVKSRDVFGRNEKGRKVAIAHGIGSVQAHSRHMVLPERSYLRSSLRENEAGIRARLRAAIAISLD